MTLIESYKKATAAKNSALTQKLKVKTDALKAQQKTRAAEGSEELRAAYASYMQKKSLSAQQNRAAGRRGGAAVNQSAGTDQKHRTEQQLRHADMTADIASIDADIKEATAATQKQIDDNNAALAQRVEAQTIKEQQAAQKKAETAQKKSAKKSASATTTKNDVIRLMKMGIYEKSFAGILGISDQEVRAYVDNVNGKNKKNTVIYPGTQKQPLR